MNGRDAKALGVAAALNLVGVAALAILGIATVAGGGRVDPFPPDHRMTLVPFADGPRPGPSRRAAMAVPRAEIPPEYRRVEPMAPRWEDTADGGVRLLD